MRRWLAVVLVFAAALASAGATGAAEPERGSGSSALRGVLVYLPSRVLDLLDVVRLRARAGPGTAIGARATEAADFFLGSYASVYAGLPGPRGRSLPRLPVGLESRSGVELSAADLSTGLGAGPDYSSSEFGLSLQLGLIGADVGLDPVELIDFAAGFFGLDLRNDDL